MEELIGEQLFDDILATEDVVKKEEDEYVPLIIQPLSENVVDINRELKRNGKAQKKKTKDAIQCLKAQVDYLFWQGKYQECIQVCEAMLKLEVTNPTFKAEIQETLVHCYMHLQLYEKAAYLLILQRKNCITSWKLLSKIYRELCKYEESNSLLTFEECISACKEGLKSHPKCIELWLLISQNYVSLDFIQCAVKCAERVVLLINGNKKSFYKEYTQSLLTQAKTVLEQTACSSEDKGTVEEIQFVDTLIAQSDDAIEFEDKDPLNL